MGKHPDLERLDYLFEKGVDFQLTDKVYEELTGAPLPKSKYYVINNSALAYKAKEKGYIIESVQEKPIIEKTIYIKKKEV